MARNVVLCLDGTGNQIKAQASTNVVRLFEMLDLTDPGRQVAYYDPGPGTFSAAGAWTPPARAASKLFGLAFGAGVRQNLAEAYTFLINHWRPDDQLFLFGFSRGAFAARALTGMIHRTGIFRAGNDNLVQYAVANYTGHRGNWSNDDWKQIDRMSEAFAHVHQGSRSAPVHFLGLWDTVRAAGILRRSTTWPYTRQLPNVAHAWHAVSIDERRRPYREYLIPSSDRADVRQVWFAGVHSDVGGTFDDPRLAEITLKWMVDGAREQGLLVRERAYAKNCTVNADHANGIVHGMGGAWRLLGTRHRPVPAGARVHSSIRSRTAEPTAAEYLERLPDDVVWDDEAWPGDA
jgi:uncharacterized protein (DUF2235 family)